MITVEEAKNLVEKNCRVLPSEVLPLFETLGRVLAEDVYSKVDIPGFPQSAMDGYAVNCSGDIEKGDQFRVVAEVQAGDIEKYQIQPGEAARIFTGAPVPDGATTIVIQEIVDEFDGVITVQKAVSFAANLREQGEQISSGDTGLQKGTVLTPAGIGFLAMMGHSQVRVVRQPNIHLIVTGNELVVPGEELHYGQIYESNSVALKAAFQKYGFAVNQIHFVKDSYEDTKNVLQMSLKEADIVVTSGGISVGDYDFVGKAYRELGVDEIFYKVKQKPGKPLFFATKNETLVFALPGNPASALTGFYQYVLPAARALSGLGFQGLQTSLLPLVDGYSKVGIRAQFLKGFLTPEGVEVLDGQSSAMMHTYAITNALVYIPWDKEEVAPGEKVVTYLL